MTSCPHREKTVTAVPHQQRHLFPVQPLGRASWDAASLKGRDHISLADAQEGLADAREQRERFYGVRYTEITERGLCDETLAVLQDDCGHWGGPGGSRTRARQDAVALTQGGTPRVGMIDLPTLGEHSVACVDSGVIHKSRKLAQAMSATTAMLDRPDKTNPGTHRLLDACKGHRIGGDSLNHGLVASGYLDIASTST